MYGKEIASPPEPMDFIGTPIKVEIRYEETIFPEDEIVRDLYEINKKINQLQVDFSRLTKKYKNWGKK